MTDPEWINFAIAVTLGLLIGAERERSKGEGPTRRSTGIRTFALVALLGAVAMHVGGVVLLATITAAVAALAGLSYFRSHDDDPGLTSEMGLLATAVLGGLAMSDALLASGLAVVVAGVFASKALVHGFVKGALTDAEFRDGLILGFATLIVWPQLPDRYLGPLDALNPHTLWLLVILVLTLGACGHVATRALGARYGLPIAGLASGFVSSTATIGSMAGRAAAAPTCLKAAVAGATLSTVATFLQMALLLFATNQPTFLAMTPILAAGGGAATLYGISLHLASAKVERNAADSPRPSLQHSRGYCAGGDDGPDVDRRRFLEGPSRRFRDRCRRGFRGTRRHPRRGRFGCVAGDHRKVDAGRRGAAHTYRHDDQRPFEMRRGHRHRFPRICRADYSRTPPLYRRKLGSEIDDISPLESF